ncbi:MAG TPA: GNAT family N-acetyltransferase [Bacteroidales bacterium]|nr:GNAT family N-acetyltransferase [Bacteroidales bacterium]
MPVTIKEVLTKKELRTFIYLPEKIHSNHKTWVYPLYFDEWDFYNPAKNRFFSACDTILCLAYRNDEPVGRIMGIINHKYNKIHNENYGRFFALECYNDVEIASALITKIEDWCRERGMEKVIGPFGFSDKDPQGFMVEGFDEPVVIATNYSLDYMPELMQQCGYVKDIDCVDYIIPVPKEIPVFYKSIYKRSLDNNNFKLKEFKSRITLRPYIRPVFELINQTYAPIYGFSPLSDKEIDYFANRYIAIINPRFVKIIYNEKDELIAFALAMPEISIGIRKAKGKLFPAGFIKIVRESFRTKYLTMLLGAIREDYRNNGIDALLGFKMLESAQKQKFELIDSHLVLETNTKMRAEYEKLGGQVKKRYRIYGKMLQK